MPASTSVVVKYALDGEAFQTLGTITSANQDDILFGVFRRGYTLELRLELVPNGTNLPEIYRVAIY
jgi:hypothetical protein